jgi:hypothetical protein
MAGGASPVGLSITIIMAGMGTVMAEVRLRVGALIKNVLMVGSHGVA